MQDDTSFMEKIRNAIEGRKRKRAKGGFPWMLMVIVALVLVGLALRGI